MKASEIKKALDPQVKKASQAAVNKIKNDIKKQNKANSMAGKTEKVYIEKPSEFGGLKELVEMKKQKAIANELDSMIFEQDLSKKQRLQGGSQEQQTQKRTPSPIEVWLAANMDKLKDMSQEDVTKLSMIINPSGGGNELSTLMGIMNMKGNNNDGGGLSDKLLGVIIEKLFKNEESSKKTGNGDMEIIKMMMAQNMKTQEMIMNMVIKQNAPKQENQTNNFMKEMFAMQRDKNDFETSFLKDKLREIELRSQGNDPLGEAKRMLDYVKTFGGAFGGGNQSPESMNHELNMKKMGFEQDRQNKEESRRASNMEQIGGMINNTIETLGKVLGEPIAEAAKTKLEQYTENVKNPDNIKNPSPPVQKKRISPEQYQKTIDLGNLEDIENIEADLAQYENIPTEKPKRTSRFRVTESGK